jgi:hypothetical protein
LEWSFWPGRHYVGHLVFICLDEWVNFLGNPILKEAKAEYAKLP